MPRNKVCFEKTFSNLTFLQESSSSKPKSDQKTLLELLKQFIEGSTVGEFATRLRLVDAFHCQLVHMEKSEQQGQAILKVNWFIVLNILCYYPVILFWKLCFPLLWMYASYLILDCYSWLYIFFG